MVIGEALDTLPREHGRVAEFQRSGELPQVDWQVLTVTTFCVLRIGGGKLFLHEEATAHRPLFTDD